MAASVIPNPTETPSFVEAPEGEVLPENIEEIQTLAEEVLASQQQMEMTLVQAKELILVRIAAELILFSKQTGKSTPSPSENSETVDNLEPQDVKEPTPVFFKQNGQALKPDMQQFVMRIFLYINSLQLFSAKPSQKTFLASTPSSQHPNHQEVTSKNALSPLPLNKTASAPPKTALPKASGSKEKGAPSPLKSERDALPLPTPLKKEEPKELTPKRDYLKREEEKEREKQDSKEPEGRFKKKRARKIQKISRQPSKNTTEKEEGGQNGSLDRIEEIAKNHLSAPQLKESPLRERTWAPVNLINILNLFIEIMKLMVTQREQERFARKLEREAQIKHMEKVVSNFNQQGKYLLMASVGAGVLGVFAGAAPILGYTKGDWIIKNLSKVLSPLKGMEKNPLKFFSSIGKMTHSMSQMYDNMGRMQSTFCEGHRTYDQHKSELARSDGEECTRSLDELLQEWRQVLNFLLETMRTEHETTRSLYNSR